MTLSLSAEEARRFLVRYHFQPRTIDEVFSHLGTVQYDPLNPVGRNHDLVLQARVPDYRVDDWQRYAYEQRLAYDAWDKQACLVPISDWAMRAPIRDRFHPWHDHSILDEHPDAVRATLEEIDSRGPLSSLEFTDRTRVAHGHSWLGPTRVKRILRALWARGELVTHHREAGRHYYDRPERVIPEVYRSAAVPTDDEYFTWITLRRHRAAGLLRPGADQAIWSVCGDLSRRRAVIAGLVEGGDLVPVQVGTKRTLYHLPADAIPLLNRPEPEERTRFVAPLDALLWDRRATREIFDFDYVWEVYKPEPLRRWGYYVLPVLQGERFVARIESRLEGKTWSILKWWWEEDAAPAPDSLGALHTAAVQFLRYLGAERSRVANGAADRKTKSALTVKGE